MKKQTIRLNESQLRCIVKESIENVLNEAYGTMNADDSKRVSSIDDYKYDPYQAKIENNSRNGLLFASKHIKDAITALQTTYGTINIANPNLKVKGSGTRYFRALIKYLIICDNLSDKLLDSAIMNQGHQPDSYYNDRHSTSHYRRERTIPHTLVDKYPSRDNLRKIPEEPYYLEPEEKPWYDEY